MIIRPTLFLASLVAVGVLSLMRCGSAPPCNTGTAVQLAGPAQGQSGVSIGIGRVVIVADGNANALYTTYGQWTITLNDTTGQPWGGAPLGLVPDPGGPHPYPSDFFYAASIPTLIPGRVYNASLAEPGASCSPISLGSFST